MDKEATPAADSLEGMESKDYSMSVIDRQLDRLAGNEARIRALVRKLLGISTSEPGSDRAAGDDNGE